MLRNTFRIFVKRFRLLIFFGVFFILASIFFGGLNLTLASEINGTIDGTYKYAWGENVGWLNFGCDNCHVSITDIGLSGYVWSKQYGWINLNPNNSGVKNTGEGVLSGYAWSPNLGWINFSGVTINSNGDFLGYATVKSDGSQINFNCAGLINSCSLADFKVETDWRPASTRKTNSSGSGQTSPTLTPLPPLTVINQVVSLIDKFLNLFNPQKENTETQILVGVSKIAPFAFQLRWNLLPVEAIRSFVFAPLPYDVRVLATKFPELDRTLHGVGIKRLTDLSKLTGVSLALPGLSELTNTLRGVGVDRLADLNKLNGVTLSVPGLSDINGTLGNSVGLGKIALIQGLPVAKLSLTAKKNLPAEFVFARANGELVDLNVAMSIGDKGEVTQKISSLPGKLLRLVVKPISSARSVTGYFVFKSTTPKITQNQISRSSLLASALFSMTDLVEKNPEPISVENKLVLSSFEYTDPDHDGIYTADVVSPSVSGEYEVITIIEYLDPVLGTRQMRLIAVIDPEGYVFEKNNGKETRIPSAVVSLYSLNNATKEYELWLAKDYQQENPQVTDIRGTYSFLVPEGSYYFSVEAPGYNPYQGKAFVVSEGSGIHQNIELKSGFGLLVNFDWQTILLIVVFLLLVYNLYRNSLRDKLAKLLNKNDGK